jgi:calcineurin-like phosphoesterase family protein
MDTKDDKEKTPTKQSVRAYLKKEPKYKVILWLVLVILAPIILIGTIIYAFSFHGMYALYTWIDIVQVALIILLIYAISLPFLAILDVKIAGKRKYKPKKSKLGKTIQKMMRVPSRFIWVVLLIAIIVPSGLIIWVKSSSLNRKGNTNPQLLISDGDGSNGIPNLAVVFWTETPSKNKMQWGYDSVNFSYEESGLTNTHAIMMKNLVPSKNYWYKINDETKTYNFSTPTNTTNSLKLALSSDPHIGGGFSSKDATENILKNIANPARNIDYFFFMGDFIDAGFDDAAWKDGINFAAPYTSKIPTRALIGNHDAMFEGANFYRDYYYPEQMELDSKASPFYQRIDINGIHILCLDLEWGTAETYFGAQETWLKNELKDIYSTDPNSWIIVMSHAFYYSSGSYSAGTAWYDNPETIEALVPLFEAYDVDMVFSGHIHAMEHLTIKNVSYSIIGSFGGLLDPDKTVDSVATSHFHSNKDFGSIELEIEGNSANLTYYNDEMQQLYSYVVYEQ